MFNFSLNVKKDTSKEVSALVPDNERRIYSNLEIAINILLLFFSRWRRATFDLKSNRTSQNDADAPKEVLIENKATRIIFIHVTFVRMNKNCVCPSLGKKLPQDINLRNQHLNIEYEYEDLKGKLLNNLSVWTQKLAEAALVNPNNFWGHLSFPAPGIFQREGDSLLSTKQGVLFVS